MSQWLESEHAAVAAESAGKKINVAGVTYLSTALLTGEKEIEPYDVFVSAREGLQEFPVSEQKTSVYQNKWMNPAGVGKYCRKFPKKNSTNCVLFSTKGLYRLTNKWMFSKMQIPKAC